MIKTKSVSAAAYVTTMTGNEFEVVLKNPNETVYTIESTKENVKFYNIYKSEMAKEIPFLPGNIGTQKVWEKRYVDKRLACLSNKVRV